MLRDLSIQNYRCFEDFQMDGLERVNLFVGNNNSGKTSLLEAIYLLVAEDKYASLIEIFIARGEVIESSSYQVDSPIGIAKGLVHVEPVEHIFLNHKFVPEHDIRIFSNTRRNSRNVLVTYSSEGLYVSSWKNDEENRKSFVLKLLSNNAIKMFESSLNIQKSSAIYIYDKKEDVEQMNLIWNDIYLTDKENKVVKALQILEPKIERIGFLDLKICKVARLKLTGHDRPIPLSSMGEGTHRILNLSMALTKAENGVLLVDEIETGLHYEAQTDMWRLILETAKELNVQVFATTHSWDCIAAYQEALSQLEDSSIGKLFRLDSKYGKLRAVEYDAEDLEVATREGIEVR